jgi:hypothetical protein
MSAEETESNQSKELKNKEKLEKLNELIVEYFKLKEYPEGEPLKAERSLVEIVNYLNKKFSEKGLGEISDGESEKHKKRNINDKVRRAINNNPKISSTKGKTTKKRYNMEGGPELPIEAYYSDIFVLTEVQGGTANITKIIQLLVEGPLKPKLMDMGFPEDIDDVSNSSLVFRWTKNITEITSPTFRKLIDEGTISHAAPPFEMIDDTTITSMFENWYTMNPYWMGTKYYGFNGPRGLDSVMNNIGKVIKENQLSEVAENPRLGNEIKWLRANKGRLNNRMIITLALLHLNRTLQESINR